MAPKRKRSKSPKNKESNAAKLLRDKDRLVQVQHEKLFREIRYSAEVVKRHEKQWRALLMTIAEPRMRKEHEFLRHWFERSLDVKDLEISLLLDELQAAEEQYARTVRSHIDDIDRIIVLCYDQIKGLWVESADMIGKLYQAATTERMDVMKIDSEHEQYLKTMVFCLFENSKQLGKLMRGDYMSRQEVEDSKLQEITTRYRDEWNAYFDHLWLEADAFMERYKRDFARRKRQFEELNKNDDEMQATVRSLWERARESYDCIKKIKTQQDLTIVTQGKKIKDLEGERDYYETVAKDLVKGLREDMDNDRGRLGVLVTQCSDVIESLETYARRGEKLLTLSRISRKFLTVEEKTLMFPTFKDFVPEKKRRARSKHISTQIPALDVAPAQGKEEEEEEQNEYLPEMKLFWLRIGDVEASRSKLLEECAILERKNAILKKKLMTLCEEQGVRSYLDKKMIFEDI